MKESRGALSSNEKRGTPYNSSHTKVLRRLTHPTPPTRSLSSIISPFPRDEGRKRKEETLLFF